jgi:hypothetical protein
MMMAVMMNDTMIKAITTLMINAATVGGDDDMMIVMIKILWFMLQVPELHLHAPTGEATLLTQELLAEMKRQCETSLERPVRQIYEDALQEMSACEAGAAVMLSFPSFENIKPVLYRTRRKCLSKFPQTISEIDLEVEPPFFETLDGKPFVFQEDG